MIEFYTIKLLLAGAIGSIALLFGLVPINLKPGHKAKMMLDSGASFAAGVFLAAGLIHLLPDAVIQWHTMHPRILFPTMFVVCVLTIFLLRALQSCCDSFWQNRAHPIPYLLAIILSIHSVIAGIALGVGMQMATISVIALAIMVHKGSAAFALMVTMRQAECVKKTMVITLLMFACMTPLGILLGSVVQHYSDAMLARDAEAIFSAMAAGTFIYIAAFDGPLASSHRSCCKREFAHLCYCLFGIVLMTLLAIWL